MNELAQFLVDGLLDRESDQGASFTYAGASYPCSGGDQMVMKLLQLGGFRQTNDTVLVVRLAVLPAGSSRPSPKQTVTYTSTAGASPVTLKVHSADTLFDSILVLACHDPNQAA